MAHVNHHFEPFVGGEEKTYHITHTEAEEAREEGTPLDLTGYGIGAEVWWEDCHKLSPGHRACEPRDRRAALHHDAQ